MNFCFEFISLLIFIYASTNIHIHHEVIKARNKMYGKKYGYLTYIGLYLTIFTLISINCFKSNIITNIILPVVTIIELYILVLFYGLILINENNLRSKDSANLVIRNNFYKETSLHLFPSLYLLINMYKRQVYINFMCVLVCTNIFWTFYLFLLHFLKSKNGGFVYPFLNKLNGWRRFKFFLGSNIIINMVALTVCKVNNEKIKLIL